MAEEKSIYEQAELVEEMPATGKESEEEVSEEFAPVISGESSADRESRLGVKKEMMDKVVTIEKWFFTKPKTKDADGMDIKPKETLKEKKSFYPGKLGIRFKEENLVEYYPNVKFYVNDGKLNRAIKLPRQGESQVAAIVNLVLKKIGKQSEQVSDKEILDYLVGKKVKLVLKKGTFNNKAWFRNDIGSFVD